MPRPFEAFLCQFPDTPIGEELEDAIKRAQQDDVSVVLVERSTHDPSRIRNAETKQELRVLADHGGVVFVAT